jgi:phosphotriesterase-related protein
MADAYFRTITGDVPVRSLGLILPHEHLFTDLRGPDSDGYAQEDPELVRKMMVPYLRRAEKAGVTAIVECSTIGVGRNIGVLARLASQTSIKIVAPTGIYKEAFTPAMYRHTTVAELVNQWVEEIEKGVGFTDHKAGFIKVALSDDGPTAMEERNLQAAAQTSLATGAAIASHTIGGEPALRELEILKSEGMDLGKFIWVHASSEPDPKYHFQVAESGAYVEFDNIGQPDMNPISLCDAVEALLGKGLGDRILLSHDAGWFQPGTPNGMPENGIRGYTALVTEFIPMLKERGLDAATIKLITEENPKRVFRLVK